MAISGGDGSIILTTKVDESGLSKGLSKLKSGVGAFGKAFAVAGAAGVAAFAGITKAAVDSYAEFEQLKGGVETLFKDSAGQLMKYADQAYKTAGLSANEYMATVTSFSASLLQSLGGDTAAAADYADQAIIDMSDNANKMGTSMESIQYAYQGFAKQNYTMLDNLKLGYGGTKEEMQRLLEDAEKISGIKYDISSFADVTQAIHVIQTELGITGTTALEASSTIQGSASAMKASWQNLLTGMADPTQNFEQLLQNFISSVGTFANNLLPVISTATQGVLQLVEGILPQIPSLIEKLLPVIMNGIVGIITGIATVLPQIVQTISEQLPIIMQTIVNALPQIIQAIVSALPTLIPNLINGIVQAVDTLINALPQIIQPIIDALPDIIISIVQAIVDNLPTIISGIINLVLAIVEAIPQIIQAIVDALPTVISLLIQAILNNLPAIIQGLIQVVLAIVQALPQILGSLIQGVVNILAGIWDGLSNVFGNLGDWFGEKFSGAWEAIQNAWSGVVEWFSGIWDSICEAFANVGTWFSDVFTSAWEGIKNAWSAVVNFFSGIWDGIVNVFNVVNTWFANIFRSAWEGIKNIWSSVTGFFSNIWSGITGVFASVGSWFSSKFNDAVSAIKNVWSNIKSFFTSKWDEITGVFKDAKDKFLSIGKNIVDGIKNGISNAWNNLKQWFKGLFGDLIGIAKKILGIASPSKVFRDEVGKQIPAGMAIGIDKAKNLVTKAMKSLITDTRSEVQKVVDNMNEEMLDSEKFYAKESLRIEQEKEEKEYQEKIKAAKNEEERQKIEFERAEKLQEEANKKYLDGLKETADKERKIHEARQKDIKNAQNNIVDAYKNAADDILDAIKDLQNRQQTLADKLIDFGGVMEDVVEIEDKFSDIHSPITEKDGRYVLQNLGSQTRELEKYFDLMTKLRGREGMSAELFDVIKNMGYEESLAYAQKLMRMGDRQFSNYIESWQKKQETSKRITEELFGDDGSMGAKRVLSDLTDQTNILKDYYSLLEQVKNRAELPEGFFDTLRDMGIEEGLEYANALLELSDEDFAKYIKAWEEKQKTSQLISKELYKDEAEQLATEIGDKFDEVEKEFFGVGENAADEFENGFMEQLQTVIKNIKQTIGDAFSGITPVANYGIGGYSINVPALARGSVLPGGKPFLAIVNDQPRGQTNVEAPLQTIVDAMNIALNNRGGSEIIREEHYNLNETELMTILHKLVKGGERLQGKSLISGGAY